MWSSNLQDVLVEDVLRETVQAILERGEVGWTTKAKDFLRTTARHITDPTAAVQLLQLQGILPNTSRETVNLAFGLADGVIGEIDKEEEELERSRPWWQKLIPEGRMREMAAVRKEQQEQTFYHGTSKESAAQGIMRDGIQPPELAGPEGAMTPVGGKVYMGKLSYAMIYALGMNDIGNEVDPERVDAETDPYGYVFVIPGSELEDIQPDEDSVGEMAAKGSPLWLKHRAKDVLRGVMPTNPEKEKHYVADFVDLDEETKEAYLEGGGSEDGDRYEIEDWLRENPMWDDPNYYHESESNEDLYDMLMGQQYAAWAEGGKLILDELDDEEKLELVNKGAHVAHEGTVQPSEVWRFNKVRDTPRLKEDGSNFFEVAERVK